MKKLAIIAASVAFTGCVSTIPTGKPYVLTMDEKAIVEAGVKKGLKDPYSAMFGFMIGAQTPDKSINVCGFVNAKNSFGGYVGETPFFGILHPGSTPYFELRSMGGSDGANLGLRIVCRQAGAPILG